MRTLLLSASIVLITVFGAFSSRAQNVIKVSPGFNTLNQAITAESEKGAEVMANTIFELERGGNYLLNGSIQNIEYPVTIRAAEGEGERPKIIPAVASGGESERPFRPRGNLSLSGLNITNRDELGKVNSRIIRCSADSITIRVDDCILDNDTQAAIRLDNDFISVFLTNSIISNIGIPSDPNNGRGIDDRGNDIDSLVIENCTMYNITSRILRDDGGIINFSRINHNHFVNIGHRLVTFGEVIEAEFTNNQVIDAGFYGASPAADYILLEVDSLKQDLVDQGIQQSFKINNNNFFLHQEIIDAYPDTISQVPMFNIAAQAYADEQNASTTLLNEDVTFANAPIVPSYIVNTFWADPASTPEWDKSGSPYDFEYSDTHASFSYASDGKQLGDLAWFDIPTGTNDFVILENDLSLSLYPNPSKGLFHLRFELKKKQDVELTIQNILGQKTAQSVEGIYSAGKHQLSINLSNQKAGFYYCKLKAGNAIQVKKIIIQK